MLPASPPKKVIPIVRSRYIFQVRIHPHAEAGGASAGGCSAFVEVEPEEATKVFGFRSAPRTARHCAEEVAQWAALQAVQKDFPHGVEPTCSAALLECLPEAFRQRHPTAHTHQARTWLA